MDSARPVQLLKVWCQVFMYCGVFVALIGAMTTIVGIVDLIRWMWFHE